VRLGSRYRRWLPIPLLLAVLAVRALPAQVVVSDTLAAQHIGELVTVEGTVHDVHVSSRRGMSFMNFGGAFPNISFSAHVPDSVSARFPGLPGLGGKRVRVTGRIWLQDEQFPAITVTDPTQVAPLE
jgi:hypothetical protein